MDKLETWSIPDRNLYAMHLRRIARSLDREEFDADDIEWLIELASAIDNL